MIYEFIGLPGAGKSYISEKIRCNSQIKDMEIKNKKEILFYAALFGFLHPIFSFRILVVFLKENRKNLRLLKHKLGSIVIRIMALEQKAKKGKHILESGFFQLLLSLYENKIKEKDIVWIIGWLKKRPYKVFIVEASKEVRERRMSERGRVPRSVFITDEADMANWFLILEHNFYIIKQVIIKNFNYEIIDNN